MRDSLDKDRLLDVYPGLVDVHVPAFLFTGWGHFVLFSLYCFFRLCFRSIIVSPIGVRNSFVILVTIFSALCIVVWDVISFEHPIVFREFGPPGVWPWVGSCMFPLWVLFAYLGEDVFGGVRCPMAQ